MITVLRFTADWCGPCKQYKPVFEKWAATRKDITILSVDVDEHPDLAKRYRVSSIPTTVILQDGILSDSHAGVMSNKQLENFVDNRNDIKTRNYTE